MMENRAALISFTIYYFNNVFNNFFNILIYSRIILFASETIRISFKKVDVKNFSNNIQYIHFNLIKNMNFLYN